MQIEPRHNNVRLLAFVDATEPVLEPMALDSLHKLDDSVGPRLSVDMMMERKVMPFGQKLATGVGQLGLLLTAAAAVPGGIAACFMGAGPAGLLATAAGGALLKKKGLKLLMRGAGHVMSAFEGKKRNVSPWNGVRTYEEGRLTDHRPLGKKRDLEAVSDFLARGMRRYPAGDLNVVCMTGHGLGHRHSIGMDRPEFQALVEKTVQKAGKPIDVLMMESCLEGNLETVAGIGNRARYVVVSEESISAGALGTHLQAATRVLEGREFTASRWASTVVRCGQEAETLAVVDTAQLPPVMQALDALGGLLRQEMAANPEALKAAIESTQLFPKDALFRHDARRLGLGDVGHFCRNLQRVYSGRPLTIGSGYFQEEARFPEAASSPRARAILDAAVQLREQVDLAVVERYNSHAYRDASGLSVQLPTKWLDKVDQKLPRYDESGAPPQWTAFVTEMSRQL